MKFSIEKSHPKKLRPGTHETVAMSLISLRTNFAYPTLVENCVSCNFYECIFLAFIAANSLKIVAMFGERIIDNLSYDNKYFDIVFEIFHNIFRVNQSNPVIRSNPP